jgi:hypothetical protein
MAPRTKINTMNYFAGSTKALRRATIQQHQGEKLANLGIAIMPLEEAS